MNETQTELNEYTVHKYEAEYSDNECNRFENLEGIEAKILNHLLYSKSRHANNLWKLLKYSTPNALNEADLEPAEKIEIVYDNYVEGMPANTKRFFMQPFIRLKERLVV